MIARICNFEELPEWVDKNDLSNNGAGKEYSNYIIIEDRNYKAVYSDAMEPEDKCFYRDLSWIVEELNRKQNKEE